MAQNKEYSSTRPPMCNLNKFVLWKARIKLYMNSIDEEIFNVILTGPPETSSATTSNNDAVPPPEWTDAHKRLRSADAKAMNILAQTMYDDIFQKVVDCSSAKEIWTSLNNMVEGSADERKDKKSHLISQYENFRKGEDESVADMYNRLSSIINELKTLDKVISLTEINDKILMCLPSSWDSRIWPIREIRSLNEISTENLLGKLKSYEQLVRSREADQSTSSPASKKDKGIAFQATEEERKPFDDMEVMSLLAKRFYKMARKDFRKKNSIRKDKQKYDKNNSNEIICYKCRKPGHILPECPENQRKDKKKEKEDKVHSRKPTSHKNKKRDKSFVAETWSDTDSEVSSTSSGSEDKEQDDNHCLLAIYDSYSESEDASSSNSSDDEDERTFCMMAVNASDENSEDSEPEQDCDQVIANFDFNSENFKNEFKILCQDLINSEKEIASLRVKLSDMNKLIDENAILKKDLADSREQIVFIEKKLAKSKEFEEALNGRSIGHIDVTSTLNARHANKLGLGASPDQPHLIKKNISSVPIKSNFTKGKEKAVSKNEMLKVHNNSLNEARQNHMNSSNGDRRTKNTIASVQRIYPHSSNGDRRTHPNSSNAGYSRNFRTFNIKSKSNPFTEWYIPPRRYHPQGYKNQPNVSYISDYNGKKTGPKVVWVKNN